MESILSQARYQLYKNGNKPSKDFTATPDKYPQKYFKAKPCRHCGTEFKPIAPSHLYCSDTCADEVFAERLLQRNYKISRQKVSEMHEAQNNLCAICGEEGFKMAEHHKSKLVVDHCHETGNVRGLLCHNCNRALGLLKDKVSVLRKAIEYLEGATTIPQGSTLK